MNRKTKCSVLAQTTRCRSIDRGTIAASPTRCSQKPKRIAVAPAPQNRPITCGEPHPPPPEEEEEEEEEPSCSARRNMTAAGAKSAKPGRSSFGIRSRNRRAEKRCLIVWSGMLMKRSMIPASPPRGRLMKKPGQSDDGVNLVLTGIDTCVQGNR